jgi:hypothetical protein
MSDLFDLKHSVMDDDSMDATLKEIVHTHKDINQLLDLIDNSSKKGKEKN